MTSTLKRLAALAAVGAVGVLVPVASASAATTPATPAFRLPSLPALPAANFGALPAVQLPAGALPSAGLAFQGPQVAIGPTVIGSVFNGGTSVVVSNEPPVNSGNVIGSP
jgi:hypothetical protein